MSKEPTEVAPQNESGESEESGASSDEEGDAEARLVQLCDEGGVLAINFLLSKAVSPTSKDIPTKCHKLKSCSPRFTPSVLRFAT